MKAAISFSRLIATAKLFFKRFTNISVHSSKPLNTAVVAGQQSFDKLLHLVRYSATPVIIKGRIAIDSNDPGVFIGKQENIGEVIKKYELNQLVFCEGEISFKKIIELTGQFAGRINFLFHAKNSNSIVGSNSKNEKGIFIA